MALAFNRNFDPRYRQAVAVAPRVRRVTARNPGPFTFAGTNTYLVGASSLAVIDPGPADIEHLSAVTEAIGDARVAHILVTHTHRDHSPGAKVLQELTGAPILAAGPHRTARPVRPEETAQLDAAADLDFSPDILLADGGIAETEDYRLVAVVTPGHTANHLAFALGGSDLLFSGDHVMGWATTIVAPPDGAMRDYMDSLARLISRTENHYLPAHGGEIRDARVYVEGLLAHRRAREQAILDALQQGDRAIPDIVARVYRGLDPSLAGAAALSALAHLEDLVERGMALSDTPPSLQTRYWPAGTSGAGGLGIPAGIAVPDASTLG